jgi:hypothetical protein
MNGLMAELLTNDGIVLKTRGEGFGLWLLKLYVLCCRCAHQELTDEYKGLFG